MAKSSTITLMPVLLFILALAYYWAVLGYTGFNGLYGQDPYGYYDYARALLHNTSLAVLPQANYWPAGYPLIIAACSWLLGEQPLAAQAPSVLAGAATVALIALLTHDLALLERRTAEQALIAGFVAGCVAFSGGQLTQWSLSAMADAPALLSATLAAWALVRCAGTARLRWLSVAGIALAAAISTRWMYALLVPVAVVFVFVAPVSGSTRRLLQAARSAMLLVAIVIIGVLPQLWLSRVGTGEMGRSHWISEWSLLHAVQRSFTSTDGQASYPLPVGLFYLRALGSPRTLSPLFWPLLPLGVWALWRWRMRNATLLLLLWSGLVYLLLAGLPYQNMRYTLAQLPIIASVAGLGAAYGWDLRRWLRPALGLFCLIAVLGGGWYGLRLVQELASRQQSDLATARWVEQALPQHAHVLVFELTLTLQHQTSLEVRELYGMKPEQLADEVALKRPLFVLIETTKIQQQWAGTPLAARYEWLRKGPGLIELGRVHGYALYRVDDS